MPERKIGDRLAAGETLLMDGGTGSELQRRGADVLKGATGQLEAWSATANIEFADVVRQVHQDYLRVGADLIAVVRVPHSLSFVLTRLSPVWDKLRTSVLPSHQPDRHHDTVVPVISL